MPQASLLTYFSKPAPDSVPLQASRPLVSGTQGEKAVSDIPITPTPAAPTPSKLGEESIHECLGSVTSSSCERRDQRLAVCSLSASANLTNVNASHLPAIKRLTATTLPVRYPDSFFSTVITDPAASELARVLLYDGEPVGWIRCQTEGLGPDSVRTLSSGEPLNQIYIQALCVLAPYRHQGFATALLQSILEGKVAADGSVICIYAHVWESNQDALQWYAHRGFKRTMFVNEYYRKLQPPGAWVLKKDLR